MMKKVFFILGICCLCGFIYFKTKETDSFTLNLIHTNDLHSHILPFDDYHDCPLDSDCLGGFARIITFLNQEKSPSTLILDAGDRFTGTAFYTLLKSKPLLPLFQKMPYDAITLGNHEFDDNLPETISFLKQWHVPVVVSNLNVPLNNELHTLIKSTTIIKKMNHKIGIIGLLTPETMILDNPDITIQNLSEVVAKEISSFKKQGVHIIIVLSHIGLRADKKLAKDFPEIDIIIGGHSHSLLSNDTTISSVAGPYPISLNQGKTLIVSTGMGGRFIGKLQVTFNPDGEILKYQGNTIPVNAKIMNDPSATKIIQKAQQEIKSILIEPITTLKTPIGFTAERNYCSEDCPIGLYLTQTLHAAYPSIDGVLLNSGSIRRGLPSGLISYHNLIETYPFDNEAVLIQLTGEELKEYLEHGIAHYHSKGKTNAMLQTAGVKYHFSKKRKKITEITVKGIPIDAKKRYTFLVSSYLANGGDGYPIKTYQKTGHTICEILKTQMKKK